MPLMRGGACGCMCLRYRKQSISSSFIISVAMHPYLQRRWHADTGSGSGIAGWRRSFRFRCMHPDAGCGVTIRRSYWQRNFQKNYGFQWKGMRYSGCGGQDHRNSWMIRSGNKIFRAHSAFHGGGEHPQTCWWWMIFILQGVRSTRPQSY